MTAVLGLAVFSHFWFWHPLVYFLSLAFSPTFLIGLNYDMKVPVYQSSNLCLMPSCPFLPTRVQPPCPPPVEFPTAVLSTLARAKARASDADKMQGLRFSNLVIYAYERLIVQLGEQQKAEPEPTFEILTIPARVVPAQGKFIKFLEDRRYIPVKAAAASGFVLLKDLRPTEPEVLVLIDAPLSTASAATAQPGSTAAMAVDDEPQPPQPFSYNT